MIQSKIVDKYANNPGNVPALKSFLDEYWAYVDNQGITEPDEIIKAYAQLYHFFRDEKSISETSFLYYGRTDNRKKAETRFKDFLAQHECQT